MLLRIAILPDRAAWIHSSRIGDSQMRRRAAPKSKSKIIIISAGVFCVGSVARCESIIYNVYFKCEIVSQIKFINYKLTASSQRVFPSCDAEQTRLRTAMCFPLNMNNIHLVIFHFQGFIKSRRKIFQCATHFTSQDYSDADLPYAIYIWTGTHTYMLINMAKYVSTQSWPLLKIYIYIYRQSFESFYCALDT